MLYSEARILLAQDGLGFNIRQKDYYNLGQRYQSQIAKLETGIDALEKRNGSTAEMRMMTSSWSKSFSAARSGVHDEVVLILLLRLRQGRDLCTHG
jgi:hypothetical protein